MSVALLWIPATLIAAVAQTARNAMQRSLTDSIGVLGATQVRFLYGFPFALIFLAFVGLWQGVMPPLPGAASLGFVTLGAVCQILATGLMLQGMRKRSFAVVTAYTKTEPVQVALVAWLLLGDALTPLKLAAVVVATLGVLLVSWKPGERLAGAGAQALVTGVGAGALFAVAAVGFRGAILSLPPEFGFLMRATTILAWGLGVQTAILAVYLATMDRGALRAILAAWRPSAPAGFLGALASQFWFIGFSLTTAANVRTLALVEVVLAQAVSRRLFSERQSGRELAGMALIVAGVAAILWLAV